MIQKCIRHFTNRAVKSFDNSVELRSILWCLREGNVLADTYFFKFRKQRLEFQLAFGGGVIDGFTPKVRLDSSNAPTEAPDIAQKLLQDPATFLLVFGTHEVDV